MENLQIVIKPNYKNRIIIVSFKNTGKVLYIPSVKGCLAVEDIILEAVNNDPTLLSLWNMFTAEVSLVNPGYNGDKELYQTAIYVFNYINENYNKIVPAYIKSGTDILSMDPDTMMCLFMKLDMKSDKISRIKYNNFYYTVSSFKMDNKLHPDLIIEKFLLHNSKLRMSVAKKTFSYSYKKNSTFYYVPTESVESEYDISLEETNALIDLVLNSRF